MKCIESDLGGQFGQNLRKIWPKWKKTVRLTLGFQIEIFLILDLKTCFHCENKECGVIRKVMKAQFCK